MSDKKIIVVFGTRPEAIKMCPLVIKLKEYKCFETVVCVTGQHREMLSQVLDIFGVTPNFNLEIMKDKQTLFDITCSVLTGMKEVFEKQKPNLVLVHGDTTTSFATALAAFYMGIPVGHVEAGLRTFNMRSPFPEEFNRCAVDLLCDLYFAPTYLSKKNLLESKVPEEKIAVTGNTAIDALKFTVEKDYVSPFSDFIGKNRLILLTAHRRENLGEPMRRMFRAIKKITEKYDDIKILYPIHKNPLVREIANEIFQVSDKILITEPLGVKDFHNLINLSYVILTDSGGIQEEAPSLGKPVLVMRDTTERPEGIDAGTLKLVGTYEKEIYEAFDLLLSDDNEYKKMSMKANPYGDGNACERIAGYILSYFELSE